MRQAERERLLALADDYERFDQTNSKGVARRIRAVVAGEPDPFELRPRNAIFGPCRCPYGDDADPKCCRSDRWRRAAKALEPRPSSSGLLGEKGEPR